ncbi:SGNH/GDSL hydrolase family protein [Burkholderia cenocepacia]|uniref:SGNH/GDSL hydrolase family protein n=1 Tax=Burkholderia cenocepacia TaxID=95486 RepID=UPI002ABE31E7|nr:SGNH/GDSL hydrolase family protein [Burkholderia cenocepacia]
MGSTLPPSVLGATSNLKLAMRNSRIWLPQRSVAVNQAMASPPTVTNNTTAQLTGATWAAGSGTSSFSTSAPNGLFTYCKGAIRAPGGGFGSTVSFGNVTTSGTPTYGATSVGIPFYHTGQNLELVIAQNAGMFFRVKVDGQYVSLTPQASAGDSSIHYYLHAFASRARRRIDIIGYNFQFVGVNTDANDTITPAEIRGPRCIFLGDSFTAGSGASAATVTNYVNAFADAMGWDDVWASGVGGTGYLNPGAANVTFAQRVQRDVIAYAPEIVFVVGGLNDYNGYTTAQIQTAATALYQTIIAGIPGVLLCVAPNINGGVGKMTSTVIGAIAALKAAAQSVGALWIDPTNLPFGPGQGGQSGTFVFQKNAGQTNPVFSFVPSNHGTYLIGSGTTAEMIQIKTFSQTGAGQYTCTMDGSLQYAHNAGETVVQVGGSYLTGSGRVGATTGYGNSDLNVYTDGTHPTDAGHMDLGQTLSSLFMNVLGPN